MAVSKRTRFEVLRRDDFTCRYCRSREGQLTIDHVLPVALGGTDEPDNLVAACRDCNAGKASTSPDEGTVAEVSDDAVRWAAAIKQASAEAAEQRVADGVMLQPLYDEYHLWLPAEWEVTVLGWLRDGLTIQDASDCLSLSLAKPYVRHDAVFPYASGIARNKIRALHQRAREIVEGKAVPDGA